MPRKRQQPAQPGEFSQLEGQTVSIVASGAGNMSEADLAAIRGDMPNLVPGREVMMTATEAMARVNDEPTTWMKNQAPAEISMAARMLTLEGRMEDLEKAMEMWAARMRTGARHLVDAPAPTRPATPEEESAYAKTNLALMQQNEPQYDGIQSWRNAGSPKLEPKLPEKKAA